MATLNQLSTHTEYNRYPEIFKEVKKYHIGNPKILSFGCSIGEECITLKNEYFIDSEIHGYDINNEIKPYNNILFYNNYNELKTYDIIFCMSVLCRWPEDTGDYSFKLFNDTLIDIDKLLNINGFLVIYNSKYLFTDSDISYKYSIINTDYKNTGFVTKYDKNNIIIHNYSYYLFKKNV